MIVCPVDDKLALVMQVDHSRVAGVLAAHWGNDQFAVPQPYLSMALAAQEHDVGWGEWEMRPTLNAEGKPVDYIGAIRVLNQTWLKFYQHAVDRVVVQDPYSALIVSMHADGLLTQGLGILPHMPDFSGQPGVGEFVGEQRAFRSRLQDELRSSQATREAASDEAIWSNYKLMEAFDQMAQFLASHYPLNTQARVTGPNARLNDVPVTVGPGIPDTVLTIDVQDEAHAVIRPYPFDVDPLVFTFPAKLIPNQKFDTQEDFLRAYYRAEPRMVTYSLHSS